jgi:hypothetical protein
VPYPLGGSFSWLWFVVYLLVSCLLMLPLFALFRGERGQGWVANFARAAGAAAAGHPPH